MHEETTSPAGEPDREAKIEIMSVKLLEVFGVNARDMVERQIADAVSDDARATWTAILERLCGPEAPDRTR